MKLPSRGIDRQTLLQRLDTYRTRDADVDSGRLFGAVFPIGSDADRIGKEVYSSFLTENGLDPTAFPSLLRLEQEVVALAATHLSGDERAVGSFTSGGTESILLAVKAARDFARATRPGPGTPEMILPTTAHAAFHKAADYLGLKIVPVDVDPATYRAVPEAIERAITPDTVLLVASAPSFAHAVVDPVAAIAEIATRHDLPLHVDACVGGFLLPYFERLGRGAGPFDFRVPGVASISMDFHKYAFCPKGASVVVFRDRAYRKHHLFACAEWTGYSIVNTAVQSSKTGGPLAAAWAVLHHVGDEGYLELAGRLLEATDRLATGIDATDGVRLVARPDFCMAAFTSDEVGIFHVLDEMKERGWYLQPQLSYRGSPAALHVTLTPGNAANVDAMLVDLEASVAAARELSTGGPAAPDAGALFGSIPADQWDDQLFESLLSMAGLDAVALPERTADIHAILDALPRPVTERVLIEFVNQLYALPAAEPATVG